MFSKSSLIYSNNGIKRISELEVNDEVLTHKNRFKNVDDIMSDESSDIYSLKVTNLPSFYTTSNQLFLTTKVIPKKNPETQEIEYFLDEPTWLPVNKIGRECFLAIPFNDKVINDSRITLGEAWLLGKFFAKGYIRKKNNIDIVIENANDNVLVYREKLQGYIIHSGTNQNYKNIYIKKGRVHLLFNEISKRKSQRTIPNYIMDLPENMLRVFLYSFIEEKTNKGISKRTHFCFTVTSKKMAYQLGRLISKAFRVAYIIEEKKQKNSNIYEVSFCTEKLSSIIRRNIIWAKIDYIKKTDISMKLVDLSINDDNSFLCNNIIVGDLNKKKEGEIDE